MKICYTKSISHSPAQSAEFERLRVGERLDMIINDLPNRSLELNTPYVETQEEITEDE